MKKFARHRTAREIKALCKERKFPFSDKKYREGSDFVSFGFVHEGIFMNVVYSSFNGKAMGELEGRNSVFFSSDSEEHEQEPWFQALLEFIYVPAEEPASC